MNVSLKSLTMCLTLALLSCAFVISQSDVHGQKPCAAVGQSEGETDGGVMHVRPPEGEMYRPYTQKPLQALDHDFPSVAEGVLHPHGIYDCKRHLGHINLGLSHDTSRFACDSVAYWWDRPSTNRCELIADDYFFYLLDRSAPRPP